MRLFVATLLVTVAPASVPVLVLHAQVQDTVIMIDPDATGDSIVHNGPPAEIVDELIRFYNDSGTTRLQGDVAIPAGSRFVGPLALHRGSLRIAGRVTGPVAVANGTLYLLPGGEVDGDILVVGGRLVRTDSTQHR